MSRGTKASRSEDTQYELGFELSAPIDPDNSKWTLGARNVQLVLAKKESGVFWAHLPKDNKKWKPHVQIDWDKWVDEDEEEESPAASGDMGDMSQLMGGAGGGKLDLFYRDKKLCFNIFNLGGMDLQSMLANMKGGEVGEQAEEDSDDEGMMCLLILMAFVNDFCVEMPELEAADMAQTVQ